MRIEGRLRKRVAAELAARDIGRADAQALNVLRRRSGRHVARKGVGRIDARHCGIDFPRVGRRQREDGYAVERAACWNDAACRHGADAGLEADDIVEAGRNAARAGRVGAERKRYEPARDRNRRSGARAAWHDCGIERIARRRVRRAQADEAGCELVEIGLAYHDGAGRAQARDGSGVCLRHVREIGAGGGSRQACDIDIVLDRKGNAPKRLPARSRRAYFLMNVRARSQRNEYSGVVRRLDAIVNEVDQRMRIKPIVVGGPERDEIERQILHAAWSCAGGCGMASSSSRV